MQKLWQRINLKTIFKKMGFIFINLFFIAFWIISMPYGFAYFTWLNLGRKWEVAYLTTHFWGGFWLVSWHHVYTLSKLMGKSIKEI